MSGKVETVQKSHLVSYWHGWHSGKQTKTEDVTNEWCDGDYGAEEVPF